MLFIDIIRECLLSLAANRLRSILAMLGIVIGVSSITVLVSIGEGSERAIRRSIESLGSNILMVTSQHSFGMSGADKRATKLSEADIDAIREIPNVKDVSAVTGEASALIESDNKHLQTQLIGATPDYFNVRDWAAEKGTVFTEDEIRVDPHIVVLGNNLAKSIFGDEEPIGTTVKMSEVPLMVVGVLKKKGNNVEGVDQDNIAITPISIAQQRLLVNPPDRDIAMLMIKTKGDISYPIMRLRIEEKLRDIRQIEPDQDISFLVKNPSDLAKSAIKTRRVLTTLLCSIASISLVVGGIGIMNIQYVCVTERTREIGIRKSIGAQDYDIMFQFLLEAVLMSLTGCAVGVFLGWIGTLIAQLYFLVNAALSVWAIMIAVGSSIAVGVFFGYYPARKAAKLLPVESLRY